MLVLVFVLIGSHRLIHTLATGEGMPAGFPRRYIEWGDLNKVLIIGLTTSITSLIITIFKK